LPRRVAVTASAPPTGTSCSPDTMAALADRRR
jgi:hypothetical protein